MRGEIKIEKETQYKTQWSPWISHLILVLFCPPSPLYSSSNSNGERCKQQEYPCARKSTAVCPLQLRIVYSCEGSKPQECRPSLYIFFSHSYIRLIYHPFTSFSSFFYSQHNTVYYYYIRIVVYIPRHLLLQFSILLQALPSFVPVS